MRLKELVNMRKNCVEQIKHDQDYLERGLGGAQSYQRLQEQQELLVAINEWIAETIENEELIVR